MRLPLVPSTVFTKQFSGGPPAHKHLFSSLSFWLGVNHWINWKGKFKLRSSCQCGHTGNARFYKWKRMRPLWISSAYPVLIQRLSNALLAKLRLGKEDNTRPARMQAVRWLKCVPRCKLSAQKEKTSHEWPNVCQEFFETSLKLLQTSL